MAANQDTQAACVKFLLHQHTQDLERILADPDTQGHHTVLINLIHLANADTDLATALFAHPAYVLKVFQAAAFVAQDEVWRDHPHQAIMVSKEHLHVRLQSLPYSLDEGCFETGPTITQLRTHHEHKLVTLIGTVVKAHQPKVVLQKRVHECAKCGHRFVLEAEPSLDCIIQLPAQCPSKTGDERTCRSTNFPEVEGFSYFTEYQEISIQERGATEGAAATPVGVQVHLFDELADRCKAGDDVEVTGVVMRFFKEGKLKIGAMTDVPLFVHANNVVVVRHSDKGSIEVDEDSVQEFRHFWEHHQQHPLQARNKILASMCPQIHGLFTVKLATAIMLAGGVAREDPDGGGQIRGEIHMLLVGDPGTGKSQFMKFAAKVSARSVITTGRGSTTAGLTASAVKDGQQWLLEAGAIVLADGGLCCIDEFDGIRDDDVSALNEPMEQQTLTIAKAGMNTTLHTRTAIFAVTNPKGAYDPHQSIAVNTSLPGPLLSRFDIMLVLQDQKNPHHDATVAAHVLHHHQTHGQAVGNDQAAKPWDLPTLRKYFQWIRSTFNPQLTPEAEAVLTGYYRVQRRASNRHAARTTLRMLNACVRIAQGHARLMARHQVLKQDAVVAVFLVDASMADGGLRHTEDAPGTGFAPDPDTDYLQLEASVLPLVFLPDDGACCA